MTQQNSGEQNNYDHLNPERILETLTQLKNRIQERFPDAGLVSVCEELHRIARDARKTSNAIARPMWGLRIVTYLIILTILGVAALGFQLLDWTQGIPKGVELISVLEAAFNDLVLIGAAILFLVTVEGRFKRRRALTAIHRLRSIAHVIDMHQLTKDPERLLNHTEGPDTASSPKRQYTRFELGRYLDYCTEMLSLAGKVGAMYVEQFPDAQAVGSVNELESLTSGLSRKIWQKIMVLNTDHLNPDQDADAKPGTPAPANIPASGSNQSN
ncbi:MAG: hypothetical protein KDA78_05805 [Planctomycetaceae bacterium]|nr:hypothetical protein [Planctomycetaceae bacterium]